MNMFRSTFLLGILSCAARGEIITLAHPEEKMPEKGTAVWSPLFQATWDKLNAELGGPAKKIEPPNELMTKLDTFKWNSKQVMPDGSWKTWSGPATADFLNQVNAEAAAQTSEKQGPFKLTHGDPNGLVAFGLLDRDVAFQKSFARCVKEPMMFRTDGKEKPVRFFGTIVGSGVDFEEDVMVLANRPVDHSFALQIRCKETDDKVILYLPAKPQDFSTACHWLRTWRSEFKADEKRRNAWNDHFLHDEDEVRIPYVNVSTNADLKSKLGGLRFHPGRKEPWFITQAEQVTRFQLHEKGARVRAEVTLSASLGVGDPLDSPTPRKFIYDRPFFVFLWRDKAEWPYFGAWIGDDNALEAFQ